MTAAPDLLLRVRTLSFRVGRRRLLATSVVGAVALLCGLLGLVLGEVRVGVPDVLRTLLGEGSRVHETVVLDWRLPRVVAGLAFGAALGVAGAVLQSITRNPLGSPDVIGFDSGAYVGALVAIVLLDDLAAIIPAALLGGIGTALLVYLLAYRRGLHGLRLVVVGIGVTAMLSAASTYTILHANLHEQRTAGLWGLGSLNEVDGGDLRLALPALAVLAVPVAWTARRLPALELGDDSARALGVSVERTRITLVVFGVGLSAVVTAVCGPIAFVALAAPQLARRLTGGAGVPMAASAAMGAALLALCDVVAVNALSMVLPVGMVTVVLGGAYLVWLLAVQTRKDVDEWL